MGVGMNALGCFTGVGHFAWRASGKGREDTKPSEGILRPLP